MRRFCATLLVIALCAVATGVEAQVDTGLGLVVGVDGGTRTLILETSGGPREIRVAPTATIRGDHGEPLMLGDIRTGDAVSYQASAGAVTTLRVARQYWALPGASSRP
jgi:hypothetical protein